MNRTRTFEDLQESIKEMGFDLSQPESRYYIEFGDDHNPPAVFDNLTEVTAFVEGFDVCMELMMP